MEARLRSWWLQIKQHSFITTGIIVTLLVLIAFIFSAYHFGWSATGFLNKTLWDWLQLLIIPLALAVIALVFQLANTRTERQIAKERYKQDQKIALDKQHEDLLQVYLDRMSELLLKEKLRTSEVNSEVRNVARVRTITVLTQLDARRVGHVFSFLQEAGLMSRTADDNVVSLDDADLHAVIWNEANLWQANLSGAGLSEANLSEAYLVGANLSNANLWQANLWQANLWQANLSKTHFYGANLSGADLSGADLSEAYLRGQLIVNTSNFSESHYINSPNLSGADLSKANLKDASVNVEELEKQACSLKGAIMPNGKMYRNSSGASLMFANLSGVDLSGVDLSGVDLSRAFLTGANLSNAHLDTNFNGTDLSGANLKGATNITIEKLEEQAKSLKGATMPDGSIHP